MIDRLWESVSGSDRNDFPEIKNGISRARTCDLSHAKRMLSQLSYDPIGDIIAQNRSFQQIYYSFDKRF